jgi:FkbM family methyltransferase
MGYSVYDTLKPLYLNIAKRFFSSYKLERLTSKYSKELQKKDIKNITFISGKPYIEHENIKFRYIPDSRGGNIHVLSDPKEKNLHNILSKNLGPDSVLVDIGANFGFFTLMASKKIIDGRIYAFEPVSETFQYLRDNVNINGLSKKIMIKQAAASDRDGHIYITNNKFGGNHLLVKKRHDSESVPTIKLDTFAVQNNIKRINLIKCDVEGAELFVLKGGKKSISKYHPTIILEIQENWIRRFGYSPSDIFYFLQDQGYIYKLVIETSVAKGSDYRDIPADLEKTNNFIFRYGKK